MNELKLYVIPREVPPTKATKGLLPDKVPTLKDVLEAVKKDLIAAGITEWDATITTDLKVGTGSVIPGGSAEIKVEVTIKGKLAS